MSRTTRKLAKAGDVEGLIEVLRAGPGKDRAVALEAIFECMGTHADLDRQLRRSILDVSLPLARDPETRVRATSISIATALRDPSAPTLVKAALSDSSPAVRVRGLLGVIFLQPPGSLGSVLRLLSDEDDNVRVYAAAALQRVGDRSSVHNLIAAPDVETYPLARDAIDESIEVLEGRRPPQPIEPFLEDG